jgi:hypothetical protein
MIPEQLQPNWHIAARVILARKVWRLYASLDLQISVRIHAAVHRVRAVAQRRPLATQIHNRRAAAANPFFGGNTARAIADTGVAFQFTM